MASLDSVRQKLHRARHHFDELNSELRQFYESKPGNFVETPTADGKVRIHYQETTPMPASFGLICGDCLQCMRSSLDYLVWELVLAAGNDPDRNNMFPIALKVETFEDDLKKRRRLKGIEPEALKVIEAYQPFKKESPEKHAFAVLEELSNINKHRRVLITSVKGKFSKPPVDIPHLFGKISRLTPEGTVWQEIPVWTYACFQDGVVKDMDITAVLDALARSITQEFLPQFERFFCGLSSILVP